MSSNNFYRRYVVFFIFSTSLGEASVAKIMDTFHTIVESMDSKVEKFETIGKKHLADPIGKNTHGTFVQAYVQMNDNDKLGVNIQELARKFSTRLNNNILRFLMLRVYHEKNEFHNIKSYELNTVH